VFIFFSLQPFFTESRCSFASLIREGFVIIRPTYYCANRRQKL